MLGQRPGPVQPGAADGLLRRWLGPGAIDRAPERFAAEARPLLDALATRIAAGDTQLFPLAEREITRTP